MTVTETGIAKMLEGKLDGHLRYDEHEQSPNINSRNGYGKKRVKTSYGGSEIRMHSDRDTSFNFKIVPKRENMVDGIEEIIVSLQAKGMSVADIEDQIKDVYNFEVSTSTISRITSWIAEDVVSWQNRLLKPIYLIVWMDGIVFKVSENSKVVNKTGYIVIGLKRDGYNEILGMWLGKNEPATYWVSVLTDMKARGLQDILITATDNLNGFTQTIRSVFLESVAQICIVHQIRNSCRYVVWKDKKGFSRDLKDIYGAPTRQAALAALDSLELKWNSKYSYAIKSWRENWIS